MMYWWFYPSRLVLFFLLPIYLLCCAMGPGSFLLYDHPAKYINLPIFLMGLLGLLAFALGSSLYEGAAARPLQAPRLPAPLLNKVLVWLFAFSVLGYALLFAALVPYPQLIVQHLNGSEEAQFLLREVMSSDKLHGTSLMTLQSLFIVLAFSWRRLTGQAAMPRRYKTMALVLLVLCVLRAWLYSERLAVIEILLPWLIIGFAHYEGKPRRLLTLAPFFGVAGLFALFSVGEYFRSWQYYQNFGGTFIEFSWTRMVGYYATALNNGAAAVVMQPASYIPEKTAMFFYKLPFWEMFGLPASLDYDRWMDFLGSYANPEYNNSSGVFAPFMDFSWLGIAVWLVFGMMSGKLANAYRQGRMAGVLLYPVWLIGVTEILRIFYWTSDRVFLLFVVGAGLSIYLARRALPGAGNTAV